MPPVKELMTIPSDTAAAEGLAPGSVQELIASFLPKEQRDIWQLAFEIRGQLLSLANLRPETAGIKFAWWDQELELLKAGNPRHPLTTKLASLGAKVLPSAAWLNEHLVAAKAVHAGQIQSTVDELRLHAFRSYGPSLFISYLQSLGEPDPDAAALISNLCFAHVLCLRGERLLASTLEPNELRFLPETVDAEDPKITLSRICELAASSQLAMNRVTGVRSVDMLCRLTDLRLRRLRKGRSAGRFALLFSAWNSARKHARKPTETQA